jgi:phosphoribosyl-AMP cyclohydrolase
VKEMRLDCDGDAILMKVEQIGGIACHTGRRRCFFNLLERGRWVVRDENTDGVVAVSRVLASPDKLAK